MDAFLSGMRLLFMPPIDGAGGAGTGGSLATMLVTFGLIILIFYFLMIRPQNKKRKDTETMLGALKKGDRVQTAGGVRGVVTSVREQTVTLKVDDTTKIEFSKSAISSIIDQRESRVEKKDD